MRTWYLIIGSIALYIAWMISSQNTAYGYILGFVAALIGGQFIQRGLFHKKRKTKKKRRRYH